MKCPFPCDEILLQAFRDGKRLIKRDQRSGFAWQLDFSSPFIATAIHAGHHVPGEMLHLMAMTSACRLFEEDCATDIMIQGLPNIVWGLDSRAVYDLNRPTESALPLTPEQFWGATIYKETPADETNEKNLAAHEAFYRFMGTCIIYMLERFDYCIVYDLHSYNISRQVGKGIHYPPVFNLGTALLDRKKWRKEIDAWLDAMGKIELPEIETTVAENHVFQGEGELGRRLTSWDPRILVLSTEVSKIYMDEMDGKVYTDVIVALQKELAEAVRSHQAVIAF